MFILYAELSLVTQIKKKKIGIDYPTSCALLWNFILIKENNIN